MKPGLQRNSIDEADTSVRLGLAPGAVELDLHEIVGSLALALDLSETYGRSGYRHHSNRIVYKALRIGMR